MRNIVIEHRSLLAVAAGSLIGCLASAGGSILLNGDHLTAMILGWMACGAALLFTYAMLFLGVDMGALLFAKLRGLVRKA